jgi:ribosomal protein S18 acetylase RimI-like enzyme
MTKIENRDKLKIRRAKPTDAARMAVLSGELGYPTTTAEMRARLRAVKPAGDNAVLVAQTSGGEVIGWIHASVERLLEVPMRAEINGLVVSEGHRSLGAGARLLDVIEKWARSKKCVHMSVRSNVLRDRAHGFYERQGYEHYKTQKAFRKPL